MNLKEIAITVGIALLFTSFVLLAVDTFYPRPEYQDYCDSFRTPRPALAPQECNYTTTPAEDECVSEGGVPVREYDESGCSIYEECSFCNKEYEQARSRYSLILLLILAPLGALAIIFGVFYKIDFIGSGFMFSGIIIMFWGTVQNFSDLNKYVRLLIVLAELILVLFIAYKKLATSSK